jgi:hypothetical protein
MAEEFPHVSFLLSREYLDEEGIWNPKIGEPFIEDGGFQINVFGTREHYLRLADAIRKFAERDTSKDGDYHEHFEDLFAVKGKVRLHIILRKDDVGDSSWSDYFPKDDAGA